MKYFNGFIFPLSFVVFFAHAWLSAMEPMEDLGFPLEPYERRSVNAQCEAYRLVFDEMFQRIKDAHKNDPQITESTIWEEMYHAHAPGLIDILRDGVKIVRDYIEAHSSEHQLKYQPYLKVLKSFWSLALRVKKRGELSNSSFGLINSLLANIVSDYKSVKPKFLKTFESLFSTIESQSDEEFYWESAIASERGIRPALIKQPLFIIYAHPDSTINKRGIAPRTFVEQYVGKSYPGNLTLFDIHSNLGSPKTKKDPHYSFFNGTFKMLLHDLAHAELITNLDEKIASRIGEQNFLYLAYQKGYAIGKELQTELIGNAIFFFFHEFPMFPDLTNCQMNYQMKMNPSTRYFQMLSFEEMKDPYMVLKTLAEEARRRLTPLMEQRYTDIISYKESVRDFEFMLRARDKDNYSFIPMVISPHDKQPRPFPIAKQIDRYVVVKNQEEWQEDMLWVTPNKNLHKDLSQEDKIIKKMRRGYDRNAYFSSALKEAHKEFWDRFIELIETNKDLKS
jgi:hypothetical protein